VTELSFEKIDSQENWKGDGGYALAVLILIAGIATLCTAAKAMTTTIGIALIVAAGLLYFRLLRTTPKVRYFPYLWLDRDGLHHIEGNSPDGRKSHFTWQEIQNAEASPPGDEFRGLILTLNRPGMKEVPVHLSADHAKQAVDAIQEFKLQALT
jgi:hypothetical protein